MDEGIFVEWLFKPGDYISKGSNLFVIEGDKAAEEIESFDEGFLVIPDKAPKPGDTVSVGQLIGFLIAEGETAPEYAPTQEHIPSTPQTNNDVQSASTADNTFKTTPSTRSERVVASPRARRAANKIGIALSTVTGTGKNGRIRERDVLSAEAPTQGQWSSLVSQMPDGTVEPFSPRQLAAIERFTLAVNQAVPVTLTRHADASGLVNHREILNAKRQEDDFRFSLGDLISYALIQALVETPTFNSYFTDNGIVHPDCINLSVAMDTEDGLLVPVINNADSLTLTELAATIRELSASAQNNSLTLDQLTGGTFTITNLGMYGIEQFTPVLNVPQGAILGVGAVTSLNDDGIPSHTLQLSLTIDHRVHDGVPAAKFLQTLCKKLSDWE
tara:strand:- start:147 stop:1307 length:1161 start_codon:yes stop_codon:yes gene_type:complete